MADQDRPEVNLEISSGFFRISTEEVIYNLTVIPDQAGLPIVEKIVEVEKQAEAPNLPADSEPYFGQISQETLHSLADLGRGLAPLEGVLGSQGGPGVDLQKISEARSLLANLKEDAGKSGPAPQLGDDFAELVGKLQQVRALADSGASSPSAAAPVEEPVEEERSEQSEAPASSRYLFDLDVVFQTLYELCTNETVKSHIATARENRDTYFDYELFLDRINEKVVDLEAEDNFLNVPIADVLACLLAACQEKPIQNLLKKMGSNKGKIFLDSVLPLEVPPQAETEAEAVADSTPPESEPEEEAVAVEGGVEDSEGLEQARVLLDEILQLVDAMAGKVAGEDNAEGASAEAGGDSEEFAGRLGQLEEVLESALPAAEQTAESQELAAFRQRLLEAVLTLDGEIRLKKEDETITAEEARQQAAAEAAGKAAAVSSQQDLEELLAELGL